MAAKAEIGWKKRLEDGTRCEVYAQHVGNRWLFYCRPDRFDTWEVMKNPPLEDWLELLDALQRRIQRRLARPQEEDRVKATILEKFPGTKF